MKGKPDQEAAVVSVEGRGEARYSGLELASFSNFRGLWESRQPLLSLITGPGVLKAGE